MGPRARRALRVLIFVASVVLMVLGWGDYEVLRALVRFLCPSCVGIPA